MSQIEEPKSGWPHHDSIAHLAPHAPIQVKSDSSPGAFHVMPQSAWSSLPVPAQFGNFVNKTALFGSEWQGPTDWAANNNKLGEWDKWKAATGDLARPLASFANPALTASLMPNPQAVSSEATQPQPAYVSPKEDERKSSDHTNSYDVSASQSPSNPDEENASNGSDEQIDVEYMNGDSNQGTVAVKEEVKEEPVEKMEQEEVDYSTQEKIRALELKNIEETQLLLNFSQQLFKDTVAATKPTLKTDDVTPVATTTETKKDQPASRFLHSGTSAFSNIEPRPASEDFPANNSTVTPTSGASFCRPPGLGPILAPPPSSGGAAPLVCLICGFSCPSKFHYNSHMNTHGDHQCTMCDYTSRTEGRLKKHMRESHTVEEQMKVGLEITDPKEKNDPANNNKILATVEAAEKERLEVPTPSVNSNAFMMNLSTTMASILDSTANALAASMANTEAPSSLNNSLNLDLGSTPNLLNTLAQGNLTSSALDQIRAFTENSNLLPEGGINLASALGAVSQALSGNSTIQRKSPEKPETKRAGGGKMKTLKCKQCSYQSASKDEQWAHARSHIPAEKQLNCKHCNFVTEYKHHLEYHYRNHLGSKPFQCKKCSYTCVNKSMLNSHMKSHTNHYHFKCVDCTYATKYCHSLKLHLRKYNHRREPDNVDLSGGDSSPTSSNNDPSTSYSSFPALVPENNCEKPPTSLAQSLGFAPIVTSQSLNYASQMLLKHHQMENAPPANPLLSLQGLTNLSNPITMPLKCPMCDVTCATQEEQLRHNMSHFMNASVPTTLASLYNNLTMIANGNSISSGTTNNTETSMETDENVEDNEENENNDDEMEHSGSECANSPTGSSRTSASCDKAVKLEEISQRLQGKSPSIESNEKDDEEHEMSVSPAVEQQQQQQQIQPTPAPVQMPMPIVPIAENPIMMNANEPGAFSSLIHQACMAFNALQAKREEVYQQLTCPHCRLSFPSQALFNIHMSYHGPENVFKCSRCEFVASDSLNFNIHLIQSSHE